MYARSGNIRNPYVMPINTILDIAILSIRAGVEASQKGNGDQLVLGRLVPVLKHAGVALAAGAAQIMVVAELVVVPALLDVVQRGLRDLEGRVEAAGAGVPWEFRLVTFRLSGALGLLLYSPRRWLWLRRAGSVGRFWL